MEQIKIKEAQVIFDEIHKGFSVMATDAAGRQYYLQDAPLPYTKADRLTKRVEQRGAINPDLWVCHIPYGSQAWLIDGMEQRQIEDERFGYF